MRPVGIEPTAFSMSMKRSTTELRAQLISNGVKTKRSTTAPTFTGVAATEASES